MDTTTKPNPVLQLLAEWPKDEWSLALVAVFDCTNDLDDAQYECGESTSQKDVDKARIVIKRLNRFTSKVNAGVIPAWGNK